MHLRTKWPLIGLNSRIELKRLRIINHIDAIVILIHMIFRRHFLHTYLTREAP